MVDTRSEYRFFDRNSQRSENEQKVADLLRQSRGRGYSSRGKPHGGKPTQWANHGDSGWEWSKGWKDKSDYQKWDENRDDNNNDSNKGDSYWNNRENEDLYADLSQRYYTECSIRHAENVAGVRNCTGCGAPVEPKVSRQFRVVDVVQAPGPG